MLAAIDKWLPGYLRSVLRRPRKVRGLKHLILCIADHFEPFGYDVPRDRRLRDLWLSWRHRIPPLFEAFRDADGRHPQNTFFYPAEAGDSEVLHMLAILCEEGFGEVEVHLHHRNDSQEGFRAKLSSFAAGLREQHGFLGSDAAGRVRYGFVHGNWALCNARPDGDWCGVNEELRILGETGCYADFTYPSAPDPTQPKMVNAIYRAIDDPNGRGQDRGSPVCTPERRLEPRRRGGAEARRGEEASEDSGAEYRAGILGSVCSGERAEEGSASKTQFSSESSNLQSSNQPPPAPPGLMLIQGPLAIDWRGVPRLEVPAIEHFNLPAPRRADLWARAHVHVRGRPDWVFAKLHTHGAVPANNDVLLGPPMIRVHRYLGERYNDGVNWRLHYVTAREMHNIVRAAEDGESGNPGEYRDYEIAAPPVCGGDG